MLSCHLDLLSIQNDQAYLKTVCANTSNRRLKVFCRYHHSSKTATNNYVQRAGFSSAVKHAWQYFIPHTNVLHCQRSFFISTAKDWNALSMHSPLLIPLSVQL